MEENQNNSIPTGEASAQEQPPTEGTTATPPSAPEQPTGGINKYIIIGGVLILIIAGGVLYRAFFVPEISKPVVTGIVRNITIVVHANSWGFDPEYTEADQGDKIILTVVNEDDYDHGFAIDAFGISQRLPALGTIQVDFVVTKAGDFPYYCSVPCGSGEVDGESRGHFDQIGKLHVRSIISETASYGGELTENEKQASRNSAMIKEAGRELDIAESEIQIDVDNTLWLQTGRMLETLEDIKYQSLYYISPDPSEGRTWIFINTTTGEVIDTVLDE